MNIVIIGSGYVGLVTGCCFAEAGNRVICVDHDERKVADLGSGHLPFYEPELGDILNVQLATGRLIFRPTLTEAVQDADIVFLAVGTPPAADGRPNLDNLMACIQQLAKLAPRQCIIVIKSTVPVGTGDHAESLMNSIGPSPSPQLRRSVVSNPEFLAEGRAVCDFRRPERILIGSSDTRAANTLAELYAPFSEGGRRIVFTDRRSAEFAKYACNAMLAARISLVNELASVAGKLDVDIESMCRILKSDSRIGSSYLQPGIGYGGSCLPKDLHALIHIAQDIGEPADMLRSTQRVNRRQQDRLLDAIKQRVEHLPGKRIAIWGLSFKPNTNDVRAAPSLTLVQALLQEGALVSAYDPVAIDTARHAMGDAHVEYTETALAACQDADALVVMTEWDEFKDPDFDALAGCMNRLIVFDARHLYQTETLNRHGFEHCYLGQPCSHRSVHAPHKLRAVS